MGNMMMMMMMTSHVQAELQLNGLWPSSSEFWQTSLETTRVQAGWLLGHSP
jgi:hypothetical protein